MPEGQGQEGTYRALKRYLVEVVYLAMVADRAIEYLGRGGPPACRLAQKRHRIQSPHENPQAAGAKHGGGFPWTR
ncbi:hypothetical protein GCM10007079_45750 [Nocardiopsis terrae]|nr:hypothetical protein GCM10007079_45750 [Nocardiopsis terrae]